MPDRTSHPPPTRMVKRDRLPTLQEVLSRNTRPPVDLYCYYLFLQREGSEDMLDFWLDVHQHENLVRAYFKDLAKNGRSVREEWPRYYEVAKKRGSAWNGLNGVTRDAGDVDFEREKSASAGDHTRDSTVNNNEQQQQQPPAWMAELGATTQQRGRDTLTAEDILQKTRDMQRTPSPTSNGPRPNLTANFSPTLRALYPHDREEQMSPPSPSQQEFATASSKTTTGGRAGRRSIGGIASSMRGKKSSAMPYIPRDSAITRTDLVASAERIYLRYLMPGAEKEIYLPNVLRIASFPISAAQLPQTYPQPDYDLENDTLARVPDMFHSQKEWVYRAMEQDSFPRFLRSKAFGNLTPISAMIRLVLGLLLMWIALSTAFSFIFLDVKPKSMRLWIILPFSLAFLFIISYAYDLDPLMVFWGVSETTAFRTLRIREPYVKKLLFGRSIWVTFLTAVLVTCVTLLFTLVPGHRL